MNSLHDGNVQWQMPPGMSDMVDAPLYLTVAVWALRQKKVITTEEVSRNFCITGQRAGDILHYITHEGRRWVTSERRVVIRNNQRRLRGIRILAVSLPELRDKLTMRQPTGNQSTGRRERQTRVKLLRMWMTQRHFGERVPEVLLSDAELNN